MTSLIYLELTKEELEKIVTQHFPSTQAYRFQLLKGGLFNTTYKLDLLSEQESYVLRVGPINRQLLLPFETGLMAAEKYVYTLLKEVKVKCPEVLVCEDSNSWLKRSYMLTKYLLAKPLSDETIPEGAKENLYQQLGSSMRRFHEIKAPKFGRVSKLLVGEADDSWGAYLLKEMTQALTYLTAANLLTFQEEKEIKDIFVRNLPLLNEIKEPVLVHADLWEGNVLVSEDAKNLVAIIDADRAIFGDPEFEFASPWLQQKPFFAGYGKIPVETPASKIRKRLYQMVYCGLDTYVWAVEYQNPEESARTKKQLLVLAAQLKNV